MRLLVCGARHYANRDRVYAHLDLIRQENPGLTICCGYNPNDSRDQGVDKLAYQWAKERGVPGKCYPAHWDDLEAPGAVVVTPKYRGGKPYNRMAGPQRNQRMLDSFKPDRVIAFPGEPTGPGTANMCALAVRAGIEPQIVRLKAESTDARCTFEIPYFGQCEHPKERGERCLEHATATCDSCGAPATHACSGWVGSFVCCFPLCDDCEGDHEHAVWPMKPAHRRKAADAARSASPPSSEREGSRADQNPTTKEVGD